MSMTSKVCVAHKCYNTMNKNVDMTFFKFPKDTKRCNLWLENCGRMDLQDKLKHKPEYVFKNCVLCESHFEENQIRVFAKQKSLKPDAVPTLFNFVMLRHQGDSADCKDEGQELLEDQISPKDQNPDGPVKEYFNADDVFRFCRICATKSASMVPIFNTDLDLYPKIVKCLPVLVVAADPLPKQVCQNCIAKINVACDLIDISVKAENFLAFHIKHACPIEDSLPTSTSTELQRQTTNCLRFEERNEWSDASDCDPKVEMVVTCDDLSVLDDAISNLKEITPLISENPQIEPTSFKCVFCNIGFISKTDLDSHKSFKCQGCSLSACEKDIVDHHMKSCLKGRKCRYCGIICERRNQLKEHSIQCKKEKLCCQICDNIFKNLSDALDHQNTHTGNNPYLCNACGKRFNARKCLQSHACHSNAEKERTSCEFCEMSVDTDLLQEHKRKCRYSLKPYCCPTCNRNFRSKSILSDHMNVHTGDKPHKCKYCGKCYSTLPSWKSHVRTVCAQTLKEYTCEHCAKQFFKLRELYSHRRTHSEQTFVCEFCGKFYTTKSSLETHVLLHNNIRQYSCSECGSKFHTNSYLKRHKLIHLPQKTHVCDECGLRFRRLEYLKDHQVLRHSLLKPFLCENCPKKFFSESGLKLHMKNFHTDFNQFGYMGTKKSSKLRKAKLVKCSKCSKVFTSSNSLTNHQNLCTGETSF